MLDDDGEWSRNDDGTQAGGMCERSNPDWEMIEIRPLSYSTTNQGKIIRGVIRIVKENADVERMSDEVREYWEKLKETNV